MAGLESPWHIAILALVALLLFGSKRLPEIGRSMGTGMREFKRSVTSRDEDEPPALSAGQGDAAVSRTQRVIRADRDTIA